MYLRPSSISKSNEEESQARARLIEKHEAQLETLRHKDSTLGQQMDQYQQAITVTKEELGKMRWVVVETGDLVWLAVRMKELTGSKTLDYPTQ